MKRRNESKGVFAALGQAVDLGMERTREKLPDLREPASRAIGAGRDLLRDGLTGVMPEETRRRRRARRAQRTAPASATSTRPARRRRARR